MRLASVVSGLCAAGPALALPPSPKAPPVCPSAETVRLAGNITHFAGVPQIMELGEFVAFNFTYENKVMMTHPAECNIMRTYNADLTKAWYLPGQVTRWGYICHVDRHRDVLFTWPKWNPGDWTEGRLYVFLRMSQDCHDPNGMTYLSGTTYKVPLECSRKVMTNVCSLSGETELVDRWEAVRTTVAPYNCSVQLYRGKPLPKDRMCKD
ncbi:hypothetical protein CDD83_2471 [Cordyceps sp. RAO-2017]|nr:hypothetical protein CDD83_2471 [Cordyceps sp. RAO-2017]